MKKLIIIILTIVIILTTYIASFNKDKGKDNRYILDIKKNYKYYKEENKNRYIKYKQSHYNLKDEDIITRVNLNLDKDFYTNTRPSKYLNSSYILINKYLFLEKNYVPADLKKIDICTKGNIYLVNEALIEFQKMCIDMKKENLSIRAISAYRDYNYQLNLYNKYLVHDSKKNVDTYSARPGFSEHQSGLVIDIDNTITNFDDFESTDEFIWMRDNAYKYGYILRYPKGKENITGYQYEAWHYRYVGKKIATYIKKHNITFDEYYVRFIDY